MRGSEYFVGPVAIEILPQPIGVARENYPKRLFFLAFLRDRWKLLRNRFGDASGMHRGRRWPEARRRSDRRRDPNASAFRKASCARIVSRTARLEHSGSSTQARAFASSCDTTALRRHEARAGYSSAATDRTRRSLGGQPVVPFAAWACARSRVARHEHRLPNKNQTSSPRCADVQTFRPRRRAACRAQRDRRLLRCASVACAVVVRLCP